MSELKPQRYKDDRPAERFMPIHEWSRSHRPGWVYEFVRLILTPVALILYRTRSISTANVPASGPVILAPNHFSNMDHFFAAVNLRRKVRFMAKSQLFFRHRVLDYIYRVGGVFPVRRGHHDEEAFVTAHAILDSGGCLLIYAEGGRSRTGTLGEAKPGVGRLALESGVPVIPVAIHGSRNVRAWKRLSFPKVTVQYGEPISFPVVAEPTREQQLEAAQQVFEPVKEMYAALEQQGRGSVIKSLREGARTAPAPRPQAHS
ncbi:MAG: lysophospholipid acyltransferase family protein [Vicinamibacteria bacterium]|jgi:1-acyl-sn-glycerol-3-phosphate acyltransferase